jgi:DNA polymerase iota
VWLAPLTRLQDYDCFYASVFENENPSLKSLPVGVKQKSILATCNYVARARGVQKLMLISEAQKICPGLVLQNGEDLTRFRDVSKKLWAFLRSHSWSSKVERLGLDEVFLDVSDIVTYNQQLINRHALADCFFHLSPDEPERGFSFDATSFFGCTYPPDYQSRADTRNPLCMRLVLASHLAGYLRLKLEEDFGYTSTCGVSVNKALAKLAGTKNKPKNQTTLVSLDQNDVLQFLSPLQIRKIPGLGFKISHLIQNHVRAETKEAIPHDEEQSAKVTVDEVLARPDMSAELLERILGGPGAERGIGLKIWNLLHGIDHTDVKIASDIPTQISIEDTYMSKPLNTPTELMRELRALSTSLVRRMHVDLLDEEPEEDAKPETPKSRKWVAHPKTLRLSTRARPKPGNQARESFSRNSRSRPLPNFIFSLVEGTETIVERLVHEAVLPLFRRLHHEQQGWNLALINICVTNMVIAANEDGVGGGRDISLMFKTQDAKLREFTVYDLSPVNAVAQNIEAGVKEEAAEPITLDDTQEFVTAWEEEDDEDDLHRCTVCGHSIPAFALPAHERFHILGD